MGGWHSGAAAAGWRRDAWPLAAAVSLATGLMLVPAMLNGSAIVYPDGSGYLSAGQHDLDLIAAFLRAIRGEPLWTTTTEPFFWTHRSWIYGLFVRVLWPLGRLPAIMLAQSLWTALALMLCLRTLLPGGPRRRLVIALLVVVVTPLPIFVAVGIPDGFAALLAVSAAMALTHWSRSTVAERCFWLATLFAAATFHNAFAITACVVCAAWAVAAGWKGRRRAPACAALIAAVAGATLVIGVPRLLGGWYGQRDLTPPFALARLLGDGTAVTTLAEECPQRRWLVCRYLAEPSLTENDFRWGGGITREQRIQGYNQLTRDQQIVVKAQAPEIISLTLRHHGTEQAGVTARNILHQLVDTDLAEFIQTDRVIRSIRVWSPRMADRARGGLLYAHPGVLDLLGLFYGAVYLASLAVLGATLVVRRALIGSDDAAGRSLRFGLCVLAFAFVNAAVCGTLAGVFGRYQARYAWPIVLAALLLTPLLRRTRARPPGAA